MPAVPDFSDLDPTFSIYDGRELLGEVYAVGGHFVAIAADGANLGDFVKSKAAAAAVRHHHAEGLSR